MGVSGGTTPAAALLPFGRRVGEVPMLWRTLVDFEGVTPHTPQGQGPTITFSRPTTSAIVLGTVLQFGFPVASPVTLDGVDYWLFDPSAVLFIDLWNPGPGDPWRFVCTDLSGTSNTEVSAQLISLIVCDPATWTGSPCGFNPTFSNDMTLVGSPALYFQF